jgi:hypothetical protein
MEDIKNVTNEKGLEEPLSTGEQVFSPGSLLNLSRASSWMTFMAIVHYVIAGFVALGIVVNANDPGPGGGSGPGVLLQLGILFLLALLGWYLQSTSRKCLKFSLDPSDVDSLEAAFARQKRYWRLVAIMTLCGVSFAIIGLLIFIPSDALSFR